jgi:transcriptional regulator with XRE-family HTH domain
MAPNAALKMALFDAGTTQLTVSQKTGIHESRLSKIVRGHVEPSDAEMRLIAKALRLPLAQLFPFAVAS